MGNSYTSADVGQILNNPGIFYFRDYGSSDSYTKSVFTNNSTFTSTPELFTQEFSDTGDVYDAIGKEVASISYSFGKPLDLDYMTKLSGGLYTKSTVTSGATAIEGQTITADWTDKKNIVLQLLDTAGVAYEADGEPAITSVTASTTGALTADDDYTIVVDPNSRSGYSIVLNTSGTLGVATTESVVIVYNTPVVKSKTKMAAGGIKNFDPIEGYFDTILKDGTAAQVIFYKGYYNGNLNLTFGTENSPEAAVSDVVINLKLDNTRTAGDQLYSIEIG